LEVLYLRNSDIPQYLIDGGGHRHCWDNLLVEKGKEIQVFKTRVFKMQGFCSCTKNI
jgi:ATP phosphoribosyltransferase